MQDFKPTMRIVLRCLLAVFVLVGLALGPARVATSAHASMATTERMDCCPDMPASSDCAKCPLMAMCAAPAMGQRIALDLPSLVSRSARRELPADELGLVGRNALPLPEPPRS